MSRVLVATDTALGSQRLAPEHAPLDWRIGVPMLVAEDVTLREVRPSDAESLVSLLTTPEITRFISEPPSTVDGFARFIAASQRLREIGQGVCFAVTLRGCDVAVGIIQVRRLEPADGPRQTTALSDVAEWGFAIGSPFWGAGVFTQAARLALAFVFTHMGVRRLEARAAVKNGRAASALRKVGARPEGLLRNGLFRGGEYLDQTLWTVDARDWRLGHEGTDVRRDALVH